MGEEGWGEGANNEIVTMPNKKAARMPPISKLSLFSYQNYSTVEMFSTKNH